MTSPTPPATPGPGDPGAVYPVSGYPVAGYPVSGYPVSGYPVSGYPVSGYPVSGYPVPGYPAYYPVPFLPPVPKPRRRWGRLIALGVIASLVAVVGGTGLGLFVAGNNGALDARGIWTPPDPLGSGPRPPAADAPAPAWTAWARDAIDRELDRRDQALLAGDEKGYLALVDSSDAKLLADQQRRFRILHEMGPGIWREQAAKDPAQSSAGAFRVDLTISYCFGTSACDLSRIVEHSDWQVRGNHLILEQLDPSTEASDGPRPWEIADLSVAVGSRGIVAATASNSWRLEDAVKDLDAAAAAADQFAIRHPAPSKYVVFLAGPQDWDVWYGQGGPPWAGAWTVPVGDYASEVVVRTENVRQVYLRTVLAHEMTHVTSLAGPRKNDNADSWWLVEGIAEYGAYLGTKISEYDGLIDTRAYIKGGWDGNPAVAAPGAAASDAEAGARYGVAYLAIRSIAEKYGQAKMINFFAAVIHDDLSLDSAARSQLGAAWSTVRSSATSYIRAAAK